MLKINSLAICNFEPQILRFILNVINFSKPLPLMVGSKNPKYIHCEERSNPHHTMWSKKDWASSIALQERYD